MKNLLILILVSLIFSSCVTERIVNGCNCNYHNNQNYWYNNSWNNTFWWRDPIILWNGPIIQRQYRPQNPLQRRPIPTTPPRRYTPDQRDRVVIPRDNRNSRPSYPNRNNGGANYSPQTRPTPNRITPSEPRQIHPSVTTPSRRGGNN